jgi:hypothetical protein
MTTRAKAAGLYTDEVQRTGSSGVFPRLVDRRVFIDKIVLSIRGDRRKFPDMVDVTANRPIGGQNRNYARSERGRLQGNGNPYEMRYGAMRLRTTLPSSVLVLRSENRPTNMAMVIAAIEGLCKEGATATVSQVELTFDLSGVSVEWMRRRIFTPARKFQRLRDSDGRRTLYVGGRTSPWQVRVYDKTDGIVRLEFIFRRSWLRKLGINRPQDLGLLRRVNLRSLIRIRRLNGSAFTDYMESLEEPIGRAFRGWVRDLTFREFYSRASKYGWKLPRDLFLRSKIDKRLQLMHAQLYVWPPGTECDSSRTNDLEAEKLSLVF